MHASIQRFVGEQVSGDAIPPEARVLEVGSRDINGSVRHLLPNVEEYIGVDALAGPGVDVVLNASDLATHFFGAEFDVVLAVEMLEHCADWAAALQNMYALLKVGGLWLLTTRSPGFPRHNNPDDHWRFTVEDFNGLLPPALVLRADDEPHHPGVLWAGRKRSEDAVLDLSGFHPTPVPL